MYTILFGLIICMLSNNLLANKEAPQSIDAENLKAMQCFMDQESTKKREGQDNKNSRAARFFVDPATLEASLKRSQAVDTPAEPTAQEIFKKIYDNNGWQVGETISGPGSTVAHTETIRQALPILLKALNVTTLVDAGCGDFNWFKEINYTGNYIGIDIVEAIIATVQKKYGNTTRSFVCGNITTDPIPKADLIVCRGCLQHFSQEDALATIKNFKASGATYLLVTTNIGKNENKNIKTGDVWPYNLELAPFNFPKPMYVIEEKSAEPSARSFRKALSLWRLEDITVS